MPSPIIALLVALVAVGITLSCLLAAAETALARVGRATASGMVAEARRNAARIEAMVASPALPLSCCAFVRVLAEMCAAAALTILLDGLLGQWWVALILATILTGSLVGLVVGVWARRLGRAHPTTALTRLAGLVAGCTTVLGPLLRPMVARDAAARPAAQEVSAEDLVDLVERVAPEEVEQDEREMLSSVFELGDTLTREVMVPRTEMIWLTSGTPLRKAVSLFVRSGFSRVPIIGTDVDDLRGVLYLKDVMRYLQGAEERIDAPVDEVMRPAVFVPESKPVDDLLRELRQGASHMAFVVDEYGGVAGLVTIEDALEEIVGEVTDEHDPDAPEIEELEPGVFRVPARMAVDELGDLFDLDTDDDVVDTVGGLLAKALGKVPLPGTSADIAGVNLTAERVEGRRKRLATVIVRRATPEETP